MSTIATTGLSRMMVCHLLGVVSWFLHIGLQFVLLPTLIVVLLKDGAVALGSIQIALSLPTILLVFFAGAVADKRDGRNLLLNLHLLAMLPPLWLTYQMITGMLSYTAVVIYAVSMGILGAFVIPARDALLTHVTDDIPRGVLWVMMAQFIAQILGYVVAGVSAFIAPAWSLPLTQAITLLIGAIAFLCMPRLPKKQTSHASDAGAMLDGWHAVYRSARLLPVWLLACAIGLFYIGAFFVSLPLLTTDIFGGGQFEISLTNLCFWGGTIVVTMVLMQRTPIRRRGRAMVLALCSGSVVLLLMSIAPSFWLLCLLCTIWGIGAGITMTMSRTIMQTKTPAATRARVLGLYNLGFIGAAPLGAFFMGLIVDAVGARTSLYVPAISMWVVLIVLSLRTRLWAIR